MVNFLVYYVQWRTKILGTIIKTFLPALSTFAIVQMFEYPSTPPLHSRNNAGIKKLFLGWSKLYRVHKIELSSGEVGRETV